MANEAHDPKDAHEMSDLEVRKRIISLGFGGDERLFIAFYRKLQQALPDGTGIVLRGIVITNKRHEDGRPFDADGPGTSDLLQELAGRPVNFQATANLVLYARDVLFGEAYYVVVPPGDNA